MQTNEDEDFPEQVRMFGYAMLLVHKQKLDYLLDHFRDRGDDTTVIENARRYLDLLCEDGPDDAAFADWCHEALELGSAMLEERAAAKPSLRVINGGRGDG